MLNLTDISERRACQLVEISRTVLRYVPKVQPENEQLQHRMVELASERRRFGYRRIHALLRTDQYDQCASFTEIFWIAERCERLLIIPWWRIMCPSMPR